MGISNNEAQNDIENQLVTLPPLSPLRCIYRVPKRLRRGNDKTYTPEVVSIGPLHHGKEHLNTMEEHKMRCLQNFLSRTKVSVNYYINKIKSQETRLRSCYAETIEFNSDQLVKIVLVDAAFLIEFFLGRYSKKFQQEDDYIFKKPNMKWDIFPDVQLLENQLPFFILEDLYDPDILFASTEGPSLIEISCHVFKYAIFSKRTEDCMEKISSSEVEIKHFVDLVRFICLPSKSKVDGRLKTVNSPSITEIHQAGVKCKDGSTKNIFDIGFADGTLVIPQFTVGRSTEVTLRNLAAFEQCHYKQMYITDFVVLMKRLIKTPKDVELLVEHGIVENFLTDTKEVSALFANLGKGVVHSTRKDFYFASLCEDLNTHCRTPWNKWKANLRQNYLHTPWAVTSIVAAGFLLILTFNQTLCSIKSVA